MSSIGDQFANLLGPSLVDPTGRSVDTKSALSNKSVVGLYFSAHWCPPCRQFTPMLSEKYRTSYRGKQMEIIFVSSDRDETSFKEYHGSMPWLALPFSARQLKESLSARFGVRGIPMLIVLDAQNPGMQVITANGREEVMNDPSGTKFFGVKVAPSFGGQGVPLGGSSQSAPPTAKPSSGSQGVVIDRSKPVTTVQVRFPDGTKISQEFNSSAKCADVLSFVSKSLGSTGGRRIKLAAGFPPSEILDMDSTLVAAGIANSQVIVQLA